MITLTAATVPGVALLSHDAAIALATISGLMIALVVLALTPPYDPSPTTLAFAALPCAALLAAALGLDPRAGALFIAIGGGGIVWHAAILRWFAAPRVALTIYAAFIVSGALASIGAIALVLARWPAALYTISHGRATGTFVLPGELAGYLIIYVPLALALARRHRRSGCGASRGPGSSSHRRRSR